MNRLNTLMLSMDANHTLIVTDVQTINVHHQPALVAAQNLGAGKFAFVATGTVTDVAKAYLSLFPDVHRIRLTKPLMTDWQPTGPDPLLIDRAEMMITR